MILRFPSRTSNWAVISEVGKYPVTLKIIKSIIKFSMHISQSPSKIIQAVISSNKDMASNGYRSYFSYIQRIFKLVEIEHILYTGDGKEIIYQILKLDSTLIKHYNQNCEIERNRFKSDYLKAIKNPLHRTALTRVRFSAHKYPIKTGRYHNVAREDRGCPFGCSSIGNEEHYILACPHPYIDKIRKP